MLRRIKEERGVDPNFAKYFQVKRQGRDLDDIFWNYGKIHGLENIVFLDDNTVKSVDGNPWELQVQVNKANDA